MDKQATLEEYSLPCVDRPGVLPLLPHAVLLAGSSVAVSTVMPPWFNSAPGLAGSAGSASSAALSTPAPAHLPTPTPSSCASSQPPVTVVSIIRSCFCVALNVGLPPRPRQAAPTSLWPRQTPSTLSHGQLQMPSDKADAIREGPTSFEYGALKNRGRRYGDRPGDDIAGGPSPGARGLSHRTHRSVNSL